MAQRLDYSRCRRSGSTFECAYEPKAPKWHPSQKAKAASKGRSLSPAERAAYAAKMGFGCR